MISLDCRSSSGNHHTPCCFIDSISVFGSYSSYLVTITHSAKTQAHSQHLLVPTGIQRCWILVSFVRIVLCSVLWSVPTICTASMDALQETEDTADCSYQSHRGSVYTCARPHTHAPTAPTHTPSQECENSRMNEKEIKVNGLTGCWVRVNLVTTLKA